MAGMKGSKSKGMKGSKGSSFVNTPAQMTSKSMKPAGGRPMGGKY